MLRDDHEEIGFPEYEFDRGMDRIPVRSSGDNLKPSKQRGVSSDPHHFRATDDIQTASKATSRKELSSSYEDVTADDDFHPPWLEEPVHGQQLSGEELGVYADEANFEEGDARVMLKEDVAALIW